MDAFAPAPASSNKEARTILFADVCKSTQLYEQYGNAPALQLIGHALAMLADITARHAGVVIKTIGDEIMCTFPDAASACTAAEDMHRSVKQDPALARVGLSLKVGVHAGEVIHEDNDVFGDAVNVAARMAGLAKADQIIATQDTITNLPALQRPNVRSLVRARVRGKEQELTIYEYLWQSDRAALTFVAGQSWDDVKREAATKQLRLRLGSQQWVVDAERRSLSIGRGEQNGLVIPHQSVSRQHASIDFSSGHFILTDRSTNGTYVRMGSEELCVRRDQIHLLYGGMISFGEAFGEDESGLVHFELD